MASIALDHDGTVYDLYGAIGVSRVQHLDWDPRTWGLDMVRQGGRVLRQLTREVRSHTAMLHGPDRGMLRGAADGLRDLVSLGHDLHVVTHRPTWSERSIRQFYAEHEVPIMSFTFSGDKVRVCRERQFDLLIDDKPATIRHAAAEGLPVVTIDHEYTRALNGMFGVPVCHDWGEIVLAARYLLADVDGNRRAEHRVGCSTLEG